MLIDGNWNSPISQTREVINMSNEFEYRVSVIVPVYNQEPYLARCVESLLAQTIDPDEMEILLIDDGSTDASPQMCDDYAKKYRNVRVIHKDNGGLSDARNCGIQNARGKYLMYLDGDDRFLPDTVGPVVDFFDCCYDEVDLVAYPSIILHNGKPTAPHYRYKVLKQTGLYNLEDDCNIYAAITRIEVCVKNKRSDNILFSSNRDFRQEDQKYCTDVILQRMKIGYCAAGGYLYEQQPDGLQQTTFYAYYLFENTMSFWEEEFEKYDKETTPKYLQALYLSDVAWKLKLGMLLPYHYEGKAYEEAVQRVRSLLNRIDSDVIVNHPALDNFQRAFYLQQKTNCKTTVVVTPTNGVELYIDDAEQPWYKRSKIEIILLQSKVRSGNLHIRAFLKSPSFQYGEKPKLIACIKHGGQSEYRDVPLTPSSWNYYNCRTEVNSFWDFEFCLSGDTDSECCFMVLFEGMLLATNFYFMKDAIFSQKNPSRSYFYADGRIFSHLNGTLSIQIQGRRGRLTLPGKIDRSFKGSKKWFLTRKIVRCLKAHKRRIWLYHDCHGVEKNNAYYQFTHDYAIHDGVERYYVINDDLTKVSHLFTNEQKKHLVRFGSKRHKLLFLMAEKIITAYVERNNWVPYCDESYRAFRDLFNADVVYLQHGILHSHQPWKYSLDRLLIDKEVVSSKYEVENLTQNYGFGLHNLIQAGMPRYDIIDQNAPAQRKILVAPSWRKYLIRQKADGQWNPVEKIFANSVFYKELIAFLNNPHLIDLLNQYDYTLELKLHPIFAEFYEPLFQFASPRVSLAKDSVNESEYSVFVSDFSSYRFDFVYLKRAIMYFFPDYDMFKSGMADYRETDLPLDGQFGDLAIRADEATVILQGILENDGKPKDIYLRQMNGFFLHEDNGQCDRIYHALMKSL